MTKANDSDHEGLKEFLSLFKDVETTFATVSTHKDQSSLESNNESISFNTIDSVSPSRSLRSLFMQSDDFRACLSTVANFSGEDPAGRWLGICLDIMPITLDEYHASRACTTVPIHGISESSPEVSSTYSNTVSLLKNESSLAWYLNECSESDLEAGI